MTTPIDPVELAKALIAAPSVTPATGAVFDALEAALVPLGFAVERFIDGIEPDGPVENLLAVRAGKGPKHFGFAGHLDVVPPGRSEEHTSELQSLMRISYAVFLLKKKKNRY